MKKIIRKIFPYQLILFSLVLAVSAYVYNYSNSSRNEELKFLAQSTDEEHGTELITPPPGQYKFVKNLPKRINGTPLLYNGISTPHWDFNGPINVGGRTRALAIDITNENIIFAAGVSGGLWRSTNKGITWSRITRPDQNPFVTALAQDSRDGKTNIWYYGTGERKGSTSKLGTGDGIYKSVDGGLTFERLPSTAFNNPQNYGNGFNWCWNIITNPNNTIDDEVWVAADGYIFKSLDGGENWETIFDGSFTKDGQYYYSVPTDIAITKAGLYYVVISEPFGGETDIQGVWLSDDGYTWTNITPQDWDERCERTVILINPQNEDVVYFFNSILDDQGSGPKFWKYYYISGNGLGEGGNWEHVDDTFPITMPQRGYDMCLAIKPDDPNIMYVGGQALYRTENLLTESQFDYLSLIHPDFHKIVFSAHNYNDVFIATDGGIFYASDEDAKNSSWTELNDGYVTSQFYCVGVNHGLEGSRTIIGGTQDQGCWLTQSGNPSENWANVFCCDVVQCEIADDDKTVYFYGMFGIGLRKGVIQQDGAVQVGFDQIQHSEAYSLGKKFILDRDDTNIMYFSAARESDRDGLHDYIWRNKNINYGAMDDYWEVLEDTKNNGLIIAIACSTVNPRHRVYYGNDLGELWRIDFANTYYYIVTPLSSPQVDMNRNTPNDMIDIAVDQTDGDKVLVSYMGFGHKSIFFSGDAGMSWTHVGGNLEEYPDGSGNGPAIRAVAILPINENNKIYFAGGTTGLYSTTELNGDETIWVQEGMDNIGYAPVYDIDVRASDYFVAVATHGSGIYSTFIDPGTMSVVNNNQTPIEFSLEQNYPNPFNPTTTIEFELKKRSYASLKIYNIQGEEVAVLVDREMAAGNKSIVWNAEGKASGTYFYRLTIGAKTLTKKMTLIK